MTVRPSPLPYRLNEDRTTIYSGTGEAVATCGPMPGIAFPSDPRVQQENAALLVRSANACDDLVKSVQGLQALVAVMFSNGPDAVMPETIDTPIGVPVKVGEIMRDAAAALAKVRP